MSVGDITNKIYRTRIIRVLIIPLSLYHFIFFIPFLFHVDINVGIEEEFSILHYVQKKEQKIFCLFKQQ